jgi:hypothetical protein
MKRERKLRAMAAETMAIIESGRYRSAGGRDVDLGNGVRAAVAGTRLCQPAENLPAAAAHGHRKLVLGAWGCGVFRNDPAVVAATFAAQLARAQGHFDHVVFAVLDDRPGAPVRAAFARLAAGR